MKKILLPGFMLLLVACGQKPATPENGSTTPNDSVPKPQAYVPDELLKDDYYIRLYGHPDMDVEKISDIKLKFMTPLWFDDYPVKPVPKNTPKAPINYKSHRIAREYKTTITWQYKEEPVNFAGHYVFTSWGCGSPCTGSAIVDVLSGRVYEGPISGSGFQVQANSRMVLGNPPDSSGFYTISEECCVPTIFVFNERTKTFEQQDMHRYDVE